MQQRQSGPPNDGQSVLTDELRHEWPEFSQAPLLAAQRKDQHRELVRVVNAAPRLDPGGARDELLCLSEFTLQQCDRRAETHLEQGEYRLADASVDLESAAISASTSFMSPSSNQNTTRRTWA